MGIGKYVAAAALTALTIGSVKAADLAQTPLADYSTVSTMNDRIGMGGEISFSFEDSEYFDDQHYLFDAGISILYENNIIVQMQAEYSNYTDLDYPVTEIDFLLGYRLSEQISVAALLQYENFDDTEYWNAGFDSKISTDRFDIEWGGTVYLTEDGETYDGGQTTLIGTFHLNENFDAIATGSFVDDDGDIYKTLGAGIRWTNSAPEGSPLDGVFVEGMGYIGTEDGVGDYSVGKVTIGKEFGSGIYFKKKGWFAAVPSHY